MELSPTYEPSSTKKGDSKKVTLGPGLNHAAEIQGFVGKLVGNGGS